MGSALSNWKTTAAGVGAAILYLVASAYQPGMSWRQWATAAGIALVGLLAKDHDAHS